MMPAGLVAPAKPAAEQVSTRGMKNQVRIRGPKPDVCFHCKSLDELENLLKNHIVNCKERLIPETVYAQFIFGSDVTFHIKDLSDGITDHFPHLQAHRAEDGPGLLPVPDAVAQHGDAKAKLKRQRAVGRSILKSIQFVDDFKYFEKEAWDTKHADGYRFKYLCRDSYQNKDRSANKARKSDATTSAFQPVNGAEAGDQSPNKDAAAARLPTYDCKGSIFVKFSASQQIVDVVYQHLPIHNATNQAPLHPLPQASASLAQNGTSHEDSGDPMDTSEMVSYATPTAAATSVPPTIAAATKGKKRKRAAKPAVEIESSELDMDDEWELNNQAPVPPLLSPSWEPDPGDGDLYRPSVVTRVPGLKVQMKQAVKQSFKQSYRAPSPKGESSASESDYQGKKINKKKASASKPKQSKVASVPTAVAAVPAPAPIVSANASANVDSDSRPTRKRTKTGCWTCRSRKLKCDENRPQCSQCARSRPPRECQYPHDDGDSPPPGYA